MIAYYMGTPTGDDGEYNVDSENLKMIAGSIPMDGNSTIDTHVKFGCQGSPAKSSKPIDCPAPERAKLEIEFPNCQKVDANRQPVDESANYRSHVAYPSRHGTCPSTHPYRITMLNLHVIYETTKGTALQWSVPYYDLHADFMNGWDQQVLRQAIDDCIQGADNGCQRISD
jgi:hypothetical protein